MRVRLLANPETNILPKITPHQLSNMAGNGHNC